jgi:hypothetical protein
MTRLALVGAPAKRDGPEFVQGNRATAIKVPRERLDSGRRRRACTGTNFDRPRLNWSNSLRLTPFREPREVDVAAETKLKKPLEHRKGEVLRRSA